MIRLRRAEPSDCALLWWWRNDPVSRANSQDIREIPWPKHCDWFFSEIQYQPPRIFVALDSAERAIGYFRVRPNGKDAEVSVTLDPAHRGKGLGATLIREGSRQLSGPLVAIVRPQNKASRRAFERAGYKLESKRTETWVYRYDG